VTHGIIWSLLLSPQALASYSTGDVYLAAPQGKYDIYDVSAGGDVSKSVLAQAGGYNAGQLAWSTDLSTMYLSLYAANEVIAIDSSGKVSTFATGLSGPTGLIMLSDGTLLVAEYGANEVTDITAGGDFSTATALASGFRGPRNFVELVDGTVLMCAQGDGYVWEIDPASGATSSFATGLGSIRTITQDPVTEDIYAAGGAGVYDITAGGSISSADLYATGQSFFAVTIDGSGRLLAGELSGTELWDVNGGGDFSTATPWATGIHSIESALNVVPSFAYCGDGKAEEDEACDDANADNTDECLDDCTLASCGDSFVWDGVEECDDANADNTDECLDDCTLAWCGDGFVWDGVESCDDGNTDDTDACPTSCEPATCGDGFVQLGVEECDDQNTDNTDECLDGCVLATCGDGFVQAGVEDCDDTNTDNTDDCLDSCAAASCGDGFVQAGVEECDDGNTDVGDGCNARCIIEEADPIDTGEPDDKDDTGCSATPRRPAGLLWLGVLALAAISRRGRPAA